MTSVRRRPIPPRALRLRRLVLCAALCMAAWGCGRDRGDLLHVYTSLDAQEAPVYVEAFERDTGVRVRWVRLSAGEALARLEAERNRPRVTVWFGGPSPEFIVAARRGLLEPHSPAAVPEPDTGEAGAASTGTLPPGRTRAADGTWTGFYFGAIGFACHQPFLEERGVACPDSWEALLDPAFRGRISVAYPYTSGTAYVMVAALLERFGEERGWEYIRRLDAQVGRYNSSGTAAVTQVGLGEAAVGIAFAHDIVARGIERGYPIALSIPHDGTATEIGAVALVRGGPNAELGRRFIDWLVSTRAQDLLAQFHRVPLHPDARVADGAITPGDVVVIDVDPERAAERQREILARWRATTGR